MGRWRWINGTCNDPQLPSGAFFQLSPPRSFISQKKKTLPGYVETRRWPKNNEAAYDMSHAAHDAVELLDQALLLKSRELNRLLAAQNPWNHPTDF
jgi:hypothetical protein